LPTNAQNCPVPNVSQNHPKFTQNHPKSLMENDLNNGSQCSNIQPSEFNP
jgi:hypothetical protein